jgi:polysaccharide pyruvyl transferase WcaK-like protein
VTFGAAAILFPNGQLTGFVNLSLTAELEYEQGEDELTVKGGNMKQREKRKRKKIAFFGHFDSSNFGNESTLQAILYNLRRFQPDAEVICISTGPQATVATHRIEAIPISERFVKLWSSRAPLVGVVRRICIGIPSELYRWVKGCIALRRIDMLIVPGSGLLSDAFGLFIGYGPYNLFKWSLIAKICGCKLLFVGVGAGPIYGATGRFLIKSVLFLADFRSYRDISTKQYLIDIGFRADNDQVYPDLVFSFPEAVISKNCEKNCKKNRRPVVGLGLMLNPPKYSGGPVDSQQAYLENLAVFVRWLLDHEYDVRLLIGDLVDLDVIQEFRELLRDRLSECDDGSIVNEPISSVENLLSQIAATDIVVAARFHNVLLSLLCDKPVIAISHHHKCESLMSAMGLSTYCLDIHELKADRLIEIFGDLNTNAGKLKPLIREKVREFRKTLDEQYQIIFNDM